MYVDGKERLPTDTSQVLNHALKAGDAVEAEIIRIADFGAFMKLPDGKRGLIHISQIADSYVKDVNDHLKIGDTVKARILAVSADGKIDLTLKTQRQAQGGASKFPKERVFKSSSFEEKLKQFLKESEERQAELRKHFEEKRGKVKY